MKRLIAAGAAGIALAFQVAITDAQELKGEYRLGVLEPQSERCMEIFYLGCICW